MAMEIRGKDLWTKVSCWTCRKRKKAVLEGSTCKHRDNGRRFLCHAGDVCEEWLPSRIDLRRNIARLSKPKPDGEGR